MNQPLHRVVALLAAALLLTCVIIAQVVKGQPVDPELRALLLGSCALMLGIGGTSGGPTPPTRKPPA